MELHEEVTYDASPGDVFSMLCDERFRAQVCEATHALSHEVSVELDGDGVRIRTSRVMPAQVPDFARKMVGETIEVVQVEQWGLADAAGGRSAKVSVDVVGQPAGMSGALLLEPVTSGGTREVLVGEVSVRIPFVGRRIEPAIADAIRAAMAKETQIGHEWLAARR